VNKARVAQLLGDEKSSTRRGSRSSLANSEHEQSHEEVSLLLIVLFVILTYKLAVRTFACHVVADTNTHSRLLSFSSFFLFFFSFRPVVRHVRHNLTEFWHLNLVDDRTRTHTNAIEHRRTARCRWCKGRYTRDNRRQAAASTNTTLVLTNPVLKTRSSRLSVFIRLRRLGGSRFPLAFIPSVYILGPFSSATFHIFFRFLSPLFHCPMPN